MPYFELKDFTGKMRKFPDPENRHVPEGQIEAARQAYYATLNRVYTSTINAWNKLPENVRNSEHLRPLTETPQSIILRPKSDMVRARLDFINNNRNNLNACYRDQANITTRFLLESLLPLADYYEETGWGIPKRANFRFEVDLFQPAFARNCAKWFLPKGIVIKGCKRYQNRRNNGIPDFELTLENNKTVFVELVADIIALTEWNRRYKRQILNYTQMHLNRNGVAQTADFVGILVVFGLDQALIDQENARGEMLIDAQNWLITISGMQNAKWRIFRWDEYLLAP